MPLDRAQVLERLSAVPYPGFTRDIVAAGLVEDVRVSADGVELGLKPGTPADVLTKVQQAIRAALAPEYAADRVGFSDSTASPSLNVLGGRPNVARAGGADPGLIPEVRRVVAVASGKGGVGKSTVAVNLAVGLARQGLRVGLLDADIYGPSIPLMMGIAGERPRLDASGRRLIPFERYGIRFMSLGFLVQQDEAVIWRGPMVMKALEQLLRDVVWGELDYLVLDLPPGTGDAQLTLTQRLHLSGAVIVSTPQEVAIADAVKGVAMFRKVNVPILGLVENMSYYQCPHCAERSEIFGHGGAAERARSLDVPFLADLPLDSRVRETGDEGTPIVEHEPESPCGRAFAELAARVHESLETGDDDAR